MTLPKRDSPNWRRSYPTSIAPRKSTSLNTPKPEIGYSNLGHPSPNYRDKRAKTMAKVKMRADQVELGAAKWLTFTTKMGD
jgi:hypothetical protein